MRIQTNTAANSALGYMRVNTQATERSIQKLSSGFRINRSADDAAGLAIANQLRADNRSLQQASRNASQGNAMLQIMDGAAQTIGTILDRMKELATQAASDNVGNQRDKIQLEFTALNDEIARIVDTTKYQGNALLSGSTTSVNAASTALGQGSDVVKINLNGAAASTTFTFDNSVANTVTLAGGGKTQTLYVGDGAQTLNFSDLGISVEVGASFKAGAAGSLDGLNIQTTPSASSGFDVMLDSSASYGGQDKVTINAGSLAKIATDTIGTKAAALTRLADLDTAIQNNNTFLGKLGAYQSRLDFASQNVATKIQNVTAAESTIRDADMAAEMTAFTKNNILQQAAQSMLSQANQGTQGILQLLRG